MEKKIILILAGFLFCAAATLSAAEPVKKESVLKQIGAVEKRGFTNLLTWPAEAVYSFKGEKKDHPKAWPATYGSRFFMNTVTRIASGVNDIIVLPWYVAASDGLPLTRHFDLPDYAWQKE
jgi:hypothetical protein